MWCDINFSIAADFFLDKISSQHIIWIIHRQVHGAVFVDLKNHSIVLAGDTLWDAIQYLARNITWIDLNVRYIGVLCKKLCQVGLRHKL